MKNLIYISVIIGTLISCSFNKGIDPEDLNEKFDSEQYPQKWQLIEMSGSIATVPPTTGSDMEYQEYYLLYSDKTFMKSREWDNVVTKETGTYTLVILLDEKYLQLIYQSNNDLIGNCTGEANELLYLNSENKLIGTWSACDGPGLIYERVHIVIL